MAADANRGYKSLSHLQSYPLISDITTSFTSSSICQRTVNMSSALYAGFITPISRVVQSADNFADANLTHLDSRFPVIKSVSAEDVFGYPRKLIAEEIMRGCDYAQEMQEFYESQVDERKGVVVQLMAGATTWLVVSTDVMAEIADFLVAVLTASVRAALWKVSINGNGAMSDGANAMMTNGTNAMMTNGTNAMTNGTNSMRTNGPNAMRTNGNNGMKDRTNGKRAMRYGTNVIFRGQEMYVIEEWGAVGMPVIEEGEEDNSTDGNGAMTDATNGNGSRADGGNEESGA
jgi:hypothetical protein